MDHERCTACGFDGGVFDSATLLAAVRDLGPAWQGLLASAGPDLRARPAPEVWSAIEYAEHTRDITALHVYGVEQALTLDEPRLPEIQDDLVDSAAAGYGVADVERVGEEIVEQSTKLAELVEFAGESGWGRGLTIGSDRLEVRRLVEHALHDSRHHLLDVHRGLARRRSDRGEPLVGPTWQLAGGSPLGVTLGDTVVTARFDAGRLSGSSGCNTYTAPYHVDGLVLSVGPAIAVTRRLCGPEENAVEDDYLRRLSVVRGFERRQDALSLGGGDGKELLRFAAVDPSAAIRGTWVVTSYFCGDSVTSVVGDVELTISFGVDTVAGHAGANRFTGAYLREDGWLTFGPLAITTTNGPDDAVERQERLFMSALALVTTVRIAGTRLDLLRGGGTYAVTAQRPAPTA